MQNIRAGPDGNSSEASRHKLMLNNQLDDSIGSIGGARFKKVQARGLSTMRTINQGSSPYGTGALPKFINLGPHKQLRRSTHNATATSIAQAASSASKPDRFGSQIGSTINVSRHPESAGLSSSVMMGARTGGSNVNRSTTSTVDMSSMIKQEMRAIEKMKQKQKKEIKNMIDYEDKMN